VTFQKISCGEKLRTVDSKPTVSEAKKHESKTKRGLKINYSHEKKQGVFHTQKVKMARKNK